MATKCEICGENEAKYNCPACSRRTCSLHCVREHKMITQCSGKRPRTTPVPIKSFDDATLLKDFDLLQDSQSSLYRCRPTAKPELLRKRDKLKSECYQRNIHLKLMPHVFSLAKSNSSTIRNRKEEPESFADTKAVNTEILWKVDWVFHDLGGKTFSDTCLNETKTIIESLERFLNDGWKLSPTKHFFQAAGISCVIPCEGLSVTVSNAVRDEIPMKVELPIREALAGQTLLEYPVFHVRGLRSSNNAVVS